MKRIAMVLVAALALTLCSCGSPARSAPPPIEHSLTADSPAADAESAPPKEVFTATAEIVNADLYSGLVQIGNTVISLPAAYASFVEAGASLSDNPHTLDDDTLSEGFLVETIKTTTMSIGDTIFSIHCVNQGEELSPLKDTTIQGILYAEGPDVFFPGGIKCGDTMTMLTEKWGKPSVDEVGDKSVGYHYYENMFVPNRLGNDHTGTDTKPISLTNRSCTVSINRNDSSITQISYNAVSKTDPETLETFPSDFTSMDGKDVVAMSYQLPSALCEFERQGQFLSVLRIDDIPYAVDLEKPSSFSAKMLPKELTEASINEEFNAPYSSLQYDVTILNNDGTVATALGVLTNDTAVVCKALYFNKDLCGQSITSQILPLNEGDPITEGAIKELQDIMTDYVGSFQGEKKP